MNANATSRWNPLRRHVLGATAEEEDQAYSFSKEKRAKVSVASTHPISDWPQHARPLKKHTWITYLYGFGDILLILVPVYFILLGVAVLTLNGKPTKNNGFGTKVEFAMDLGPTIFPIVFAAIIGRSMKMMARFLAERGAKLSTLELLMASHSVWGMVESQFLMQRLTIVGANLLFLWALSPLGGQASLRLMSRGHQTSHASMKLRYLTTGPGGAIFSEAAGDTQRRKYAEASALYNAALLAPQSVKTGPRDSWGNVKIPSLQMLDLSKSDPAGWVNTPAHILVPETYSSLVGIPIAGLPTGLNSSFSIEYNYLSVSCGAFDQQPYPGTHGTGDPTATNYTKLDKLLPGQIWWNKSEPELHPFDSLEGRASFLLDTTRDLARMPIHGTAPQKDADVYLGRLDGFIGNLNVSHLSESERNTPRELVFASVYGISRDGNEQGLNIAKCSLSQHHVEAAVQCAGTQCATFKLRKSTTDTRPTALTVLEYFGAMEAIAKEFPTAVKFKQGSSPTELFMANTSTFPFVQKAGRLFADEFYTNLSTVSPDVFSQRLSLVLNTYYQLSTQSSGYFGDLTTNLSAYGPDTLPVTDVNAYLPANLSATEHSFFDWFQTFGQAVTFSTSPFLGATTTADTSSTKEIFVCSYPWLVLLLVSSIVILVTGGVAVVLKRRTLGPEMFGFVTSMTYENPWVKIPQGGTTLDAMERARLLKDMEVHIGDVRGDDDTGHIAFAAGVPLRRLERGRLYL